MTKTPVSKFRSEKRDPVVSGSMLLSILVHIILGVLIVSSTPEEITPTSVVTPRPTASIEIHKALPLLVIIEPPVVEVDESPVTEPVTQPIEDRVADVMPEPVEPEELSEPVAAAEPPPTEEPEVLEEEPDDDPPIVVIRREPEPNEIPLEPVATDDDSEVAPLPETPVEQLSASTTAGAAPTRGDEHTRRDAPADHEPTAALNPSRDAVDVEGLVRGYRHELQRALRSEVSYPPRARRRSIEGTVVVEVRLDDAGRIVDVRLFRSSGHEILDSAVLEAVLALGRLPAPPDELDWEGRPIRIPFPFRLT